MRKRIKRIIAAICFMSIGILLTGCTPKDSGLYQISVEEYGEDNNPDGDTGNVEDVSGDSVSGSENDGTEEIIQNDLTTVEQVTIYVHICGAVLNPGVYEFRIGDRVFDAVEAAGGFAENASEDYVNLAMELSDAMKITIPTVDEVDSLDKSEGNLEAWVKNEDNSGVVKQSSHNSDNSSETADGRININTADAATLMTISGIGETRAAAILAYRDVHGAFEEPQDITRVSGIGDSTYEKIKDRITTGK